MIVTQLRLFGSCAAAAALDIQLPRISGDGTDLEKTVTGRRCSTAFCIEITKKGRGKGDGGKGERAKGGGGE